MKILNLVSNTPEWLAHRRQHLNASEASIMMSASENVTRNELLHMKSTGLDQEFSDWFQKNILDRGHEVEALARPIAESIIGEELYPISATDDEGWLAASFDGMTMLEDKNWECKQWNEKKAAEVKAGKVPDCDYWQVMHQLAVNPGSETLYMVTDGTEEKTVYLWVKPDQDAIRRLKAGWRQFEQDLAEYQIPEAEAPKAEGKAPDALPALSVQVQGMVTASNLREFEESAMATLAQINTDLQTDSDFADAEKTVKFCKDVESRLDGAKENVLGQMQTVDEVVKTIDRIKEETRQIRLKLDKAVKEQKEQRKLEILNAAREAWHKHMGDLEKALEKEADGLPVTLHCSNADFAGAMKGKRTISSLRGACDDELARAKIEANETAELIRGNILQLKENAFDYRFLFRDFGQICMKPADDFAAVVKMRIADYQAEQEAKAKREAEAEAAAQRGAEEKARPEQAPPAPQKAQQTAPIKQSKGARLARPSTNEILEVLATHYGVSHQVVIGWLNQMNLQEAA